MSEKEDRKQIKMRLLLFIIIFSFNSTYAGANLKSVECALTYRIIHFTDISIQEGRYNICVDGDNEIFTILQNQLRGLKFKGTELKVSKFKTGNLNTCSLIYLGVNSEINHEVISQKIEENKLLVFSSTQKNMDVSLVFFKKSDKKIEFIVNKSLLDKHEINMSSKVLRLASEVR